MAFGNYFYDIFPVYEPMTIAFVTLALVTTINLISLSVGTAFQKTFTFLNLSLILLFIIYGLINSNSSHYEFKINTSTLSPIFSSSFASSLVYVSFAFSGWNSVTYVIDEIDDPKKTIPKALFTAIGIVLVLYVALNFIFLYSTPIYDLENKVDVASIAANNIFGTEGGRVISAMICIALFASVNSMLIAGPRIIKVIGEDFPFFKKIASSSEKGTPVLATLIMSTIALGLILSSQYEMVFTYIGFTLSIFTLLTVIGLFVLRNNQKNSTTPIYKSWGFPITAIIFIALEGWMMVFLLMEKPNESIAGLITILSGLIVYFLIKKKDNNQIKSTHEI
jgi:APA family basic amino acid/polyamine antiporter